MDAAAIAVLATIFAGSPSHPMNFDTQREPDRRIVTADFARPVCTYSIVARDPKTGEMGVAVQSHWFSVGPIVPWARAGVGAVATQSLVKVSYGPDGLELMAKGKPASEALRELIAKDEASGVRQVAMVDAKGDIATHTGDKCIAYAGHRSGTTPDGVVYSVQANLMRTDKVPGAMAAAFSSAGADAALADRMIRALHAAEAAGGDVRGRQSAAMLIVRGEPTGNLWEDRLIDLRVEDHPDPVGELDRLVRLHRAYDLMNQGDLAMEKGDTAGALKHYSAARELAPGNSEMVFWTAVSLVNAGKVEEALPLLAEAYRDEGGDWRATIQRLPASGLLPGDAELMKRLLGAGGATDPQPGEY